MVDRHSILITGAGGFTGEHACQHFVNLGWDVIAAIRTRRPKIEGVIVVQSDLTNPSEVDKLISQYKPDFLLHLAALNSVATSWSEPLTTLEVNVASTVYLLEAIRKNSPETKVLVVGSAMQYLPERTNFAPHPYSLSKTLQSQLAVNWSSLFDLDVLVAKPTNLIGPGQSNGVCSVIANKLVLMEKLSIPNVLYINDLSVERDFLDVRDAVRAYEILLLQGKKRHMYDIGTGEMTSLKHIITEYRGLINFEFDVKEKENFVAEFVPEIKSDVINKLGFTPVYTLEKSLRDTLLYYRSNTN